jgi:hypothetical protein
MASTRGIPTATIWAYGARPLHKHFSMFQITRALYRWHWDHGQIRQWFHSDTDDRLYYRPAPNEWQFCINHPRRQRNQVLKNQIFQISNSDLPDDLRRTVISRSGQLTFAFGSARDELRDLPATEPTTFVDSLKTHPQDAQWALRDIKLTDNGRIIAQAIRDGTAIAVSNGSFKDYFGTASWWWKVPHRATEYTPGH